MLPHPFHLHSNPTHPKLTLHIDHPTSTGRKMHQQRRGTSVRPKPHDEDENAAGTSSKGPSPQKPPHSIDLRHVIAPVDKDDDGKRRVKPMAKLSSILLLLLVVAGFLVVLRDFTTASSSVLPSLDSNQLQQQQQAKGRPPTPDGDDAHRIQALEDEDTALSKAMAQFMARARKEHLDGELRVRRVDGSSAAAEEEEAERVAVLYYPSDVEVAEALRDQLLAILGLNEAREDVLASLGDDGCVMNLPAGYSTRTRRVQVWFTTHVPPYGYGNGHGLSSFVRLLSFPTTEDSPVFEDAASLGDFVRWHCRLSHALAHTRALTLDLTQEAPTSSSSSSSLLGRLWEFLALDPSRLLPTEEGEEDGLLEDADDAKPVVPPALVDAFVREVGLMEGWPCGFFEGPEKEALRPACGAVPWVECEVDMDWCNAEPPCAASERKKGKEAGVVETKKEEKGTRR